MHQDLACFTLHSIYDLIAKKQVVKLLETTCVELTWMQG